jgi:hypothetical protein
MCHFWRLATLLEADRSAVCVYRRWLADAGARRVSKRFRWLCSAAQSRDKTSARGASARATKRAQAQAHMRAPRDACAAWLLAVC